MTPAKSIAPAALFAVLLGASGARAATYHVAPAPEGDDGGDGSAAHPFATIARAARVVAPGDRVIVAAGEYAGFDVDGAHGTEAAPIAFVGVPGARITSPGPVPARPPLNAYRHTYDWPEWPFGISVQRSEHVILEGFEIVGMPDGHPGFHRGGAAIRLEACRHVTVRKNKVDDNGRWGIFSSFCDDLVVEDNDASRSHGEHGIYLSNSGDRPIVRRNRVWGNRACGIQINADNDWDDADYGAFAVADGVTRGAVVEANVAWDNGRGGGAAINLDGVVDAVVTGNVVYENRAAGIALFQEDGATASRRATVTRNTVVMPEGARAALVVVGCAAPNVKDGLCTTANAPYAGVPRPVARASGSTGAILRENVLVHRGGGPSLRVDAASLRADPESGAAYAGDANVFGGAIEIDGAAIDLAAWRARTGEGARSIAIDGRSAVFADEAHGDFTLKERRIVDGGAPGCGGARPIDLAAVVLAVVALVAWRRRR